MVATVLKLVGFDLQRQLARLKAQAEDFKDRTTDEIKHKAVNAGLAIGFAFAGLVFVVLTIVAGLIALYLWVEMQHGRFAGLGAVALTTMLLAACLFILAATRGSKEKKREKPAARVTQDAGLAVSPAAESLASSPVAIPPHGSFVDAITQDLTDRTAAAANEALDTAAGIVRKSPREAILAALAVAVVAGVVVGRRRGR
jgi:hypothetical protein